MHLLEVYVYGGGEIVHEVFKAIAVALGTTTFERLFKLSCLLAGFTAVFSFTIKKDFLICLRWFASYYLAFCIMLFPKVDIKIIDRVEGNEAYVVSDVSLGLGLLAHVTSSIGDTLTSLMEYTFALPDNLSYHKTGMVMASRLALASRELQITDPILNANMERFMVQCVHWPIMLGHYSMNDLMTTPNLLEFVKQRAPKSRSFLYENPTAEKQLKMCNEGAPLIIADLKKNEEEIAAHVGHRLFPQNSHRILSYLPIAHNYLLGLSGNATNALQQSIMANAITNSQLYFGMSTHSQAAVANYAATRAQEQQRLTQQTIGFQAGYWLPIMKNVFEVIMYGCFIFVVLLTLFPFGLGVLKNYVYTLAWLQTWAPLYAIINLICSYYARVQTTALSGGATNFILKNYYSILQVNHDMASLAGYLSLSVPFIAAGIVKGMAGTMTNVAQYMGGISQATGSQAASEAIAGNISMGVTSMRNNSSFNTSSFQQDLRAKMSSGMSYQLPGGENINFMPDGNIAVDRGGTLSNLGVNVDLVNSIQNANTQLAEHAYTAAKGESVAAGENYQSGMRSLYEIAEHAGSSTSSGKSWVASESSGAAQALNKVQDLTQQFAKKHDISYDHAKEILTRASGGIGISGGANISSGGFGGSNVGGNVGVNANVGVDGAIQNINTAREQKLYTHAEDYVKKTGYSENVDLIQRAAIDRTLHTTNEQGARLVESMGGHFESSRHLRKESETHFQEAEAHRKAASHSQEVGIQTRTNIQQEFLGFIGSQPNPHGPGNMSIQTVLGTMRKDPEYTKTLVDGFTHNYAKANLSNWNQGMANSQSDIQHVYKQQEASLSNQGNERIQEQQLANKEQIRTSAEQKGLLKNDFIDTSVKDIAEARIRENKQEIQHSKEQLNTVELTKEQKFTEEKESAKQFKDGVLIDAVKSNKNLYGPAGAFIEKTPREKINDKLGE